MRYISSDETGDEKPDNIKVLVKVGAEVEEQPQESSQNYSKIKPLVAYETPNHGDTSSASLTVSRNRPSIISNLHSSPMKSS